MSIGYAPGRGSHEIGVQHLLAQDAAAELPGYYATIPWTEGTADHALAQAQAGRHGLPMLGYTFAATKDGNTYTGVFAGGDFENGRKDQYSVVVVPLKIIIGSGSLRIRVQLTRATVTFSAVNRFKNRRSLSIRRSNSTVSEWAQPSTRTASCAASSGALSKEAFTITCLRSNLRRSPSQRIHP